MWLLIINNFIFILLSIPECDNLSIKPEQDTISRPAGSSVVITCSSSIATTLKWLDASGNEITNDYWDPRISLDILSSSSKKLIITNTQNSDTGHYTCVGNVSGSLQEKSIKLIIFKGITFDEVPLHQHLVVNTDSTIICKVSGETDPVVYWKFNKEKVVPGAKYIKIKDGLKVVNATERDAGIYICSAEIDNAGLLESKAINVTVHVPPRIVRGVGKNEAVQGEDFNFTCLADGYPTPIFEFHKIKKNGTSVKLREDNRRIVLKGNLLMFKPTVKDDEGYYKCIARNEAGVDESAIGLYTVFVPAKVVQFEDVIVDEGGTASMICRVDGDPTSEVSMGKKQDDHHSLYHNISYERMKIKWLEKGSYQLQILDIEPDDAGIYFCMASNLYAEDVKYARIRVQYSPRINKLKTLPLVYIWAGISKNLTIHFASSPMPNATWYHGLTELKPNDTFKSFIGTNFSSLQIFVTEPDQTWIYGEYKCVLSNLLGQAEVYVELKRATIPSFPEVTLIKSHATDVWLAISPPIQDGGMPITGYIIQNQGTTQEFGLDKEVRMTDLKPNTRYLFIVRAKNAVGTGIPRRLEVLTKGISEPSIYIVKDQWEQSKAFDHRIFWRINTTGGMPILEYEVQYKKLAEPVQINDASGSSYPQMFPHFGLEFNEDSIDNDESSWLTMKVKDNLKHPMNGLLITDLEPKSLYVLKLRARNAIGWSAFTRPSTFVTAEALQSELEMRHSRGYTGLLPIIIFLFVSFLLVMAAIIDVMCCYCCDKGLTRTVFLKCSKSQPTSNLEKQNLSLLSKQVPNEIPCTSATSHTREECCERGKFKKKREAQFSNQCQSNFKKCLA